jgi:hypothetical protein
MTATKVMMKDCSSKMISRLEWQDGTLKVTFAKGGTYHYPNVELAHAEDLFKAESTGSHFHQHIKPRYIGVKQPASISVRVAGA